MRSSTTARRQSRMAARQGDTSRTKADDRARSLPQLIRSSSMIWRRAPAPSAAPLPSPSIT
jgi:hypothetical protein